MNFNSFNHVCRQIGHDKTFPALIVGSRDTLTFFCDSLHTIQSNSYTLEQKKKKYWPSLIFTSGLKCLSDVDYSTMNCVATLLGSEKPGLGDWRGIGVNYGMEAYEIDALANEAPVKRGRMVLEYLQTSKPNLTVFDFCRTLKEDTFKRFDIVKKLDNHFLVSI